MNAHVVGSEMVLQLDKFIFPNQSNFLIVLAE